MSEFTREGAGMIACLGCETPHCLDETLQRITSANNTSLHSLMLPSASHAALNIAKQDASKSDLRNRSCLGVSCQGPLRIGGVVSHGEPANPDAHHTDTGRCRNVLLLISPQSALLWLSQAHCLWFICCYTVESIYFSPSTAWFFLCFRMIVAESRQAQHASIKEEYTYTLSCKEIYCGKGK